MLRRTVAVGIALAMPVFSSAYAQGQTSEGDELQRLLERKYAPAQMRSAAPQAAPAIEKQDFHWIKPQEPGTDKEPVKPDSQAKKSSMTYWDRIVSYFRGEPKSTGTTANDSANAPDTLEAGVTRPGGAPTASRTLTPSSDKVEVQQIAQAEVSIAGKNSYVIQLKPTAKEGEIDALLEKYQLEVTKSIAPLHVITVKVKETAAETRGVGTGDAAADARDAKSKLQSILEPPLIRELREEGIVSGAFVNSTMGAKIVPKPSTAKVSVDGESHSWRWYPGEGKDGNWGLKAVRIPPVWTILDRYRKEHADLKRPKIGVIDGGFVKSEDENPSIAFNSMEVDRPFSFHTAGCDTHHGMHVAGIIGARHGQGSGIDGMVPGARIDAIAVDNKILGDSSVAGVDEGWEVHTLLFDDVLLKTLSYVTKDITTPDNLRVVNISLGYNFVARNLLGDTDPKDVPGLALHILHQSNLIRHMAGQVEDRVLFVVAAGNDSEGRVEPLDTRWASPFAWAGTQESGAGERPKNILVVEAVDRDGNRAGFSNTGGHVAAPGVEIMSVLAGGHNPLGVCSGTSQAAPFAAGLAAILFELDPSKTPAEVADIIKNSARPPKEVSGTAGMIDALEAVAQLSPLNIRYAADLSGDGKVDDADMSVFSRQLASIEGAATTNAAFTEDLNGDGVVNDNECFWPLIDINGSGRGAASELDARVISGSRRSDIQALALTWATDADPTYQVALTSSGLGQRSAEVLAATLGRDGNPPLQCRGLVAPAGVVTAAVDGTRSPGPAAGEGAGLRVAEAAAAAEAAGASADPAAVKQEVEKAVETMRTQHPKLEVKINPATGMPSSITGLSPTAGAAGLGATRGTGELTEQEIKSAVEGYFGQGGTLWAAFPTQNKQAKPVFLGHRKDPDYPDRHIADVEQQVNKIPVFGSSCKVTVERSLGVTKYMGTMSNVAIEDTTPKVTVDDAKKEARKKLEVLAQSDPDSARALSLGSGAQEGEWEKAELIIFDPALLGKNMTGPTRLAYMVTLYGYRIFVDAQTGESFYHYRDQPYGMLRRIFDLAGTKKFPGTTAIDEGQPMRAEGLAPDALAAFRNAGVVRDFYFLLFGRDSYNDKGDPLESYVRYDDPSNAFWCSHPSPALCPKRDVMVYGRGFASAIDVVGHELTHGVIAHGPDLIYHNESGAVNESLADIFGALIEFEARGDSGNWLIGENAPGFSVTEPLRSMAEPKLTDTNGKSKFNKNEPFSRSNRGQPDHYSDVLTGHDELCGSTVGQDNGCVHFNSGILNKFAFLISEGGEHHGVTVTGIGRYKLARIAYRAMTVGLTKSSGLMDAATSFVNACQELAGSQTQPGIVAADDCLQVGAAQRAVGLGAES